MGLEVAGTRTVSFNWDRWTGLDWTGLSRLDKRQGERADKDDWCGVGEDTRRDLGLVQSSSRLTHRDSIEPWTGLPPLATTLH